MNVKALLLTMLCAATLLGKASAGDASLFTYDRNAVNTQMSSLNKVENYASTHSGVTLDQLKAENNAVLANTNINATASSFSSLADGPLGIPSWIWGCVLGWVGILIVYLITQDSEETKKALWGCLAWTAVIIIVYVVFFVLLAASSTQ